MGTSRTRIGALSACAVLTSATLALAGPARAATTSPNLVRNPGAETTGSPPDSAGGKVKVTNWTVTKKSNFTAVAYGTPAFPDSSSPGPKQRGKNFFAGGPDGAVNTAKQVDSLSAYVSWIKAGTATFALTGYLGGYSSQDDRTVVSLTWLDSDGIAVGDPASIGPVKAAARHDTTGMLRRATTGDVPTAARSVRITITMRRADGTYDDGYADNISLTLSSP